MDLVEVNEAYKILADASVKLSVLLGKQVEIKVIDPPLPEPTQLSDRRAHLSEEILQITIVKAVCHQMMISPASIHMRTNARPMPDARKIAGYLLHKHTSLVDKEIAAMLSMSRSMVVLNRKAFESLLKTDEKFRFQYTQICKLLRREYKKIDF